MNEVETLKMKMAALEAALLQQLPEMPTILQDIHTSLRKDPEMVTLLAPEEIGLIVRGLKQHVNIQIATSIVTKKKDSLTKKIKSSSESAVLGMLGGMGDDD
jgi:hypothetical protein